MVKDISFERQTVLITGASRGLGHAYANLFEERGATVVVNDVDWEKPTRGKGGSPTTGSSENRAESFAISGSAVNGGDLVEQILMQTGRIDALVLNAGFLRDRSFAKATEDDLRDLLDVHLIGPWRTAKAAWPAMVAQGFGRIVFTTSPAGLYGGFGQSGYSAAKAALVGLTRTLAIEGKKHGIGVNCVAPLAASRLSAGVLPQQVADRLPPAAVAGLVAYLCHPSCAATGQVYEAAGGSIARQIVHRSVGVYLSREPSPEAVRDAWLAINDVAHAENPDSSMDALLRFVSRWPDAADLEVTA